MAGCPAHPDSKCEIAPGCTSVIKSQLLYTGMTSLASSQALRLMMAGMHIRLGTVSGPAHRLTKLGNLLLVLRAGSFGQTQESQLQKGTLTLRGLL